jgi:uncharacterized membrane protein YbhN (UPF0104 family)
VAHPVASALVGLTAFALAGALPIAPGGPGVAGAGMALALQHSGVPASSAVAAAVAFHALETLVVLVFGWTGWLALRSTGSCRSDARRGATPCASVRRSPARA